MSRKIDLSTVTVVKSGNFIKSGEEYALVLQTPGTIDQILALQAEVFDQLSETQKTFIVPKDREFFEKHFETGSLVLGIVHNGELIAQSIAVLPTEKNPKTGMVDMILPAKLEEIAVLQGMIVHPDYRGNNLMSLLVKQRIDLAENYARTDAISEVAVDNLYSWRTLLKEGLEIHSIGIDPDDGTVVYNMHAHLPSLKGQLTAAFNTAAAKQVAFNDLDEQKKLLNEGYKGVSFDEELSTFTFKKPTPKSPAP